MLFAVYAYFTLALIAEQQHCSEPFIPVPIFLILKVVIIIIKSDVPYSSIKTAIDIITIVSTVLIPKFVFFIGWLEVALSIDDPWDGRDRMDYQVGPFFNP